MSISILQRPKDVQPAQSPIVFSVITSGSEANAYTASGFQYTANLYAWTGFENNSGSYIYQARKYPNPSGSGIFDFSKMINSTISTLGIEDDGGNGVWYNGLHLAVALFTAENHCFSFSFGICKDCIQTAIT